MSTAQSIGQEPTPQYKNTTGGQYSNTAPPNAQNIYQAVDWLEISFKGEFQNLGILENLRDKKKEVDLAYGKENVEFWLNDDTRVFVQSYTWGKGSNYLGVCFEYRGMQVGVSLAPLCERLDGSKDLQIKATGEILTEIGLAGVLSIFDEIKKALRFKEKSNHVTRVDLCADVACDTHRLVEKVMRGHMVTRVRKFDSHGILPTYDKPEATYQTIKLGERQKKAVRIYDKVEELSAREKKEQVYLEHVTDGEIFEKITRVEFVLGRESLMEHGIDSWEDFCASAPEVCEYLCADWFRITGEKVDRRNSKRASIDRDWEIFQEGFLKLGHKLKKEGNSKFKRIRRKPSRNLLSPSKMIKNIAGQVANYFVKLRQAPEKTFLAANDLLSCVEKTFYRRFIETHGETYRDFMERGLEEVSEESKDQRELQWRMQEAKDREEFGGFILSPG